MKQFAIRMSAAMVASARWLRRFLFDVLATPSYWWE